MVGMMVVRAGSQKQMMKISIPKPSLVVLVGRSGSGKSSFAREHFLPTEILSSDGSVDSPGPERPVQVEGGANQGQMRERLREVTQGLAAVAGLLSVKAEMVGVNEH